MEQTHFKNLIVIDLNVSRNSPAGSCVLMEIEGLVDNMNITVVSTHLDQRLIGKVDFHRIYAPKKPLFVRYALFTLLAHLKIFRLKKAIKRPKFSQGTQGQYFYNDICYAHFCHKGYLREKYLKPNHFNLRDTLKKINHRLNAFLESKTYKNARVIVVPSKGLAGDFMRNYPKYSNKIRVVPNPIDVEYFKKTNNFSKDTKRQSLGLPSNKIVCAFAALGNFEAKGLHLLIKAMKETTIENKLHLMVIGGTKREIYRYSEMAKELGVDQNITFVGFQQDIRPYLWVSDFFSILSQYETFSLVALQAAAAGLPILATKVYGIEDYLTSNENGWFVERTHESVLNILTSIVNNVFDLEKMGQNALKSAMDYNPDAFKRKWQNIYQNI